MKKNLFFSITIMLVLLLTMVLIQSHTALAQDPYYTGTLTLVDEAGYPLVNYPADYPAVPSNLSYKYRCGGSWSATTSFRTDAIGQTIYSIGCDNWDNKVTVTLNQTTKEQDVTVNSIFQASRVNANLKSCDGLITNGPGGTVDQGGGYWYTHGTTGSTGTVSFYTFPSTIRLRMSYNHNSLTLYPTILAGSNEVDFQTTKVTTNYVSDIKSNKGGSWWMFGKPSMDLLPGDYPFYFWTGSTWEGPVMVSVSGCEMSLPYGDTNQPPTIETEAADASGNEGSLLTTSGSFTDPDGDVLTITGTGVGTVTGNSDGSWSWSYTPSDNGTGSVTVTVDDGKGGIVTDTFEWTAHNIAPDVTITNPVEGTLYTVNTSVNLSATFTDPGSADTHTYSIDWDDNLNIDTGVASGGIVSVSHAYTVPGVYTIDVTVTDDDEGFDTESVMVVVYDPNGGFVTGGGWIMSPEGAYTADPFLTGKASFGFVAKYKKGANVPDGNTEFQFKAGDLNFHSTSYEWLVVAGSKAQFKGEGTINGQGNYKFMIFADDDSPDTFRIQIWGDIGTVYDNGSQQGLGGGSIVVHK